MAPPALPVNSFRRGKVGNLNANVPEDLFGGAKLFWDNWDLSKFSKKSKLGLGPPEPGEASPMAWKVHGVQQNSGLAGCFKENGTLKELF